MTPTEIKIHKQSANLELIYEQTGFMLSAEYLRVFSPSAEVQGHSPNQAVLQYGKRDVTFRNIEPQGNYAIKIEFSDGHNSGIYSWSYLYELGARREANWADYLQRLAHEGKTREPRFIAIGG